MQDATLTALFIIQYELQGQPCATRPVGAWRVGSVAAQIAGIVPGVVIIHVKQRVVVA